MLSLHKSLMVVCGLVAGTILSLSLASSALAAPTIELTRGAVEPVESITTQLGAVINNGGGSYFTLHLKPTGGAGCGANPRADAGEGVLGTEFISSESNPVNETRNWTFQAAGSYKICAWVTKDSSAEEVQAFTETTVVVRAPHLALSISVPASVLPSQTFQVATTAQAETERQVWEYVMPNTGDACPANADAAGSAAGTSEVLGYWSVTGGPFTETKNESLTMPGIYLFCAYFQYPGRESVPELTAKAMTTVVAPPPPCVVPQLASGASLASVEQKIRAADCTVGSISSVASTKVARGVVLSLNPAPGTKLSAGAVVNIVESGGRPCLVPVVKSGSTLAHVEHQLAAADCAASISHLHSRHVRRGLVIGLASRPHTRLSPRAKVRILVSVGRSHRR
jgi:hypothetical protein